MAMTRQQLRHQSAIARYKADRNKPPSRKQMQAWLDPIRKAMAEIRTGEIDAYRGYPITRIHHAFALIRRVEAESDVVDGDIVVLPLVGE